MNITTLVKDIYAVIEKGLKLDAEKLAKMISNRLELNRGGPALRMSTLGEKCTRKLWYRHNHPELAEPLSGHTLLNFLNGDIIEETVLSAAEQSGHVVEHRQRELDLFGVKGHMDAVIDGVVVDVKSANTRSIDKFKNHRLASDDPFGYMDQIQAYAAAARSKSTNVAFLVADKELGHLVLDQYPRQEIDWEKRIETITTALDRKTQPPPRAYQDEEEGKSGNRKIPLQCRYCQYKQDCWKDSNEGRGLRKFIYTRGPQWLTKVIREPKVTEAIEPGDPGSEH